MDEHTRDLLWMAFFILMSALGGFIVGFCTTMVIFALAELF